MEPATATINGIRQMVERAASAETVEDAVRWILDALAGIVRSDVSAVLLVDDDGTTLRIKAARGLESESIARFERAVGTGVLADIVWAGRTHGVREADPSSDEYKDLRIGRAFRSGVAAPIGAGGRHIGYVWVQSNAADAFDLTQFSIVALSAALAGEVVSHIIARNECAMHVPVDLETGLLRHVEFMRRLWGEVERARRGNLPVSVMVARIDGLYRLRARGGKTAVTDAVRELGRVARSTLRGIDLVGGGAAEKMEACLPDTSVDDAVRAGERVRAAMAATAKATWPDAQLTIGVGVAAFPAHGDDGRAIVARASEAALVSGREGGVRTVGHEVPGAC